MKGNFNNNTILIIPIYSFESYLKLVSKLVLLLICTSLTLTKTIAQIQKVIPDFPVGNTNSSSTEGFPSVAVGPDGNFVVAWEGDDDIYAQRFNATGESVGDQIAINVVKKFDQKYPSVAMFKNGDFVITWQTYVYGIGQEINARRFNADGESLGNEFRVNSNSQDNQTRPAIASSEDGSFVITWQGYTPSSSLDIFARKYDNEGQPVGLELSVNSLLVGGQSFPSVAMDALGNFIITWESGTSFVRDIYARRYNPSAIADEPEFKVNSNASKDNRFSAVTMNKTNGSYIITWTESTRIDDNTISGIKAKFFSSLSDRSGREFVVSSSNRVLSYWPRIATSGNDENLVIAWSARSSSNDPLYSIFGQRYDATDGTPIDQEFFISEGPASDKFDPSIGLDQSGDMVVAWSQRPENTSESNIVATLYELSLAPELNAIPNQAVEENELLSMEVMVEDKNTNDTWNFSLDQTGIDLGMKIAGNGTTAQLTWTPTTQQAGIYQATVQVEDQASLSDEITINILVTDLEEAPVLAIVENQEIIAESLLTFQVSANDPNGDMLNYGLNQASLDLGMTLNETTGVFNWTPDLEQVGSYEVTLKASDGSLVDEETITIQVKALEVLSIDESMTSSITLHPNPTVDWLQIGAQGEKRIESYVISDMSGHEILKGRFTESRTQISVTHLSIGTYLLTVHGEDWVQYQRFVKSN